MKPLIFVCNRLIKLVGNGAKALCYVFHFFFPNKRFTIPKQASPFFHARQKKKISAILWQTNYTNRVSLPVYLNYLCNRLLAPAHEYRFMGTEDRLAFVRENFPAPIYESYIWLNVGAAQADFWRLLVLNKYGGTYMDIDAHLVWPLSFMIQPTDDALYVRTRENHYTNYFISSAPGNPHLDKAIEILVDNINRGRSDSVYTLTGPPVLNQALADRSVRSRSHRYVCVQGSFTNEYFQYIDKPKGKWTHAKPEDLLHQTSSSSKNRP